MVFLLHPVGQACSTIVSLAAFTNQHHCQFCKLYRHQNHEVWVSEVPKKLLNFGLQVFSAQTRLTTHSCSKGDIILKLIKNFGQISRHKFG